MSLPLTPVVGYVRADTRAEMAPLRMGLVEYASRAGLVICHVCWESTGAFGPTLPGFAGCLEMVRKATARGILLPSWGHLAPNPLLGVALLRAAARVDAPVYVVDVADVPDWAVAAASMPHEVRANAQATTQAQR